MNKKTTKRRKNSVEVNGQENVSLIDAEIVKLKTQGQKLIAEAERMEIEKVREQARRLTKYVCDKEMEWEQIDNIDSFGVHWMLRIHAKERTLPELMEMLQKLGIPVDDEGMTEELPYCVATDIKFLDGNTIVKYAERHFEWTKDIARRVKRYCGGGNDQLKPKMKTKKAGGKNHAAKR